MVVVLVAGMVSLVQASPAAADVAATVTLQTPPSPHRPSSTRPTNHFNPEYTLNGVASDITNTAWLSYGG
jgi:hypothetical protein